MAGRIPMTIAEVGAKSMEEDVVTFRKLLEVGGERYYWNP